MKLCVVIFLEDKNRLEVVKLKIQHFIELKLVFTIMHVTPLRTQNIINKKSKEIQIFSYFS